MLTPVKRAVRSRKNAELAQEGAVHSCGAAETASMASFFAELTATTRAPHPVDKERPFVGAAAQFDEGCTCDERWAKVAACWARYHLSGERRLSRCRCRRYSGSRRLARAARQPRQKGPRSRLRPRPALAIPKLRATKLARKRALHPIPTSLLASTSAIRRV